MKKLRKAAKNIANYSAVQNNLKHIPTGYDIIDLNYDDNKTFRLKTGNNFLPPTEIVMHKEGSVKQIYKAIKKIK